MRWIALVAGAALVVLAFAAASRVTDTREGQVAEAVTLLGGLAGILLLTYAWMARPRPAAAVGAAASSGAAAERRRSSRDLVLGAGGIALALVLLGGLAFSGGVLWAGFGLALLVPMLAGCVYLCVRFFRSAP